MTTSSSVPRPLVLASSSPRRRELLGGLGLRFTVRAAEIDETPWPAEEPASYVLRLAEEKAVAAARPGEVVLAADTTVVVGGEILGKPVDEADARRMLGLLAGREHEVLTGVAVLEAAAEGGPGRRVAAVDRTLVRMAALTPEEIAWYAASGEPHDRAGAYAIQGLGALFVAAVTGNYSNVVGLPIPTVYRLFAELGYDLKALSCRA
ncbi:MAG TPA: septum formation protein Maf [Acidobacteria bacterium]|nr:septum formation protein Maf [Acidobacteriota bacterium]